MIDYHVHSRYSVDGRGEPEAFCAAALGRGLCELGFAEHFDCEPADAGYGFLRLEAYLEHLDRCRERYAGRLQVRAGLELGEPHRHADAVAGILARAGGRLDYLIGSVHWHGGGLVGDRQLWAESGPEERYRSYFEELLLLARHGGFEVLGHLDLVSRYPAPGCPARVADFADLVRAVLEAIVGHGIVPEINVSGLRRGICGFLPPPEVLRWYRELGGRVVAVGSDAHHGPEAGEKVLEAVGLARGLGFPYLARFHRRTLVPLALG
jgi:histidinol-phosphatase (PHP family)